MAVPGWSTLILVFDAWEHAFYLQYKNQKVDFVEAMWKGQLTGRGQAVRRRQGTRRHLLLAP